MFLFTALFVLCCADTLMAQSFAIKANAGTKGIGGELGVSLHEKVNVRAGANFFTFSYFYETAENDDFDVDAGLNFTNFSGLIDWHPFGNSLRLTGGFVYNDNTITAELQPKQSYTIGGDVYSPDELGILEAAVTFNPFTPYLALGFGNAFRGRSFGMNLEMGAMFQGSPRVAMEAEGLLEPSAGQGPQFEQNLSWFTAYPVLTVSLYYRINRPSKRDLS